MLMCRSPQCQCARTDTKRDHRQGVTSQGHTKSPRHSLEKKVFEPQTQITISTFFFFLIFTSLPSLTLILNYTMLPRYSPIPDSDVEKQPLVDQPYSTCHCQQVHEQQRRRGPSKSNILILSLLILLALGYGHQYRNSHDTIDLSNVAISSEPQEIQDSLTQYCHETSAFVPWDGKAVYDLETGVTGLTVEQKFLGNHVSPLVSASSYLSLIY